jgi:RNA polymerase sigma-70 factor (ECF subfamily)
MMASREQGDRPQVLPREEVVAHKVPAVPSFRSVFEQHHGYVCSVIRRAGVPERDIEDVAHDAFVVIHRKLGSFDPELPLRPWLFGVAFRVAVAHRRRVANRAPVASVVAAEREVADSSPNVEEHLAREDRRRLVQRALDALDEDKKAVFVMHELDGIPIPDAAQALEIPLNTAYSRLRTARELFTAAIRRLQKGSLP